MSTAAPTRGPRRWRRWLWRLALGAVVARLLLAVFLPQLIAFGAGFAGLRATMRSASLSLLGLSLRLEDVELRSADHPDAPPLLTAQDVVADLSLRQLLRGELLLVDAALGGAEITVQRSATGELSLPKAWTTAGATVVAPPPAEPGPISFALPLRIGSARLHDVTLRWQDLGCTPPVDERCTVDVDARELGHPGHSGQLSVRLHSPRWFDELWLHADAITEAQRLQLDWRAVVRGVRPAGLPLDAELVASLAFVDALGADLRGRFTGAVAPASPRQPVFQGELDVDLRGDGTGLLALHAEAGPSTTTTAGPQLPFQLAMQAPGLVQQLALSGGALQLGSAPSMRGELRGTGVTLARLRPLLAARGLELPADGLRAQLGFDAEFGERLSLQLRDLELAHGDDRLAIAALHVRELQANDTGLAIDSIELQRPQLALQRTAAGGFRCAGITFTPVAAAPVPTPTQAPATAPRLPRLRLGSLALLDGTFVFTDRTRPEPAVLTLSACTLRGDAWTIGQDAPPGRFTLQARLDDAIEQLQVEATLAAKAQELAIELQAQATAMTLHSLRPWLQSAGLEPRLANGSLTLVAGTTITELPDGLEVEARLANLRYRAGDELLLGVRAITGTGLRLGADRFELGSWRVDEPFLDVLRTADGGYALLGLALPPAEPDAPAPDRTAPTGQPAAQPSEPPAAEPAAALAHGPLLLQGGVVQLRDADAAPLRLGFDGELAAHADAGPQAFRAALRLDGAVDRAQLRGTVQQVPLALTVELELQGLRGQGLQRFLPPHVRCTLVDGTAQAKLQLQRAAFPGNGVQLQLDGVQLRDRDQELVGFDQLRLDAPALGADRIHIAALVGTGLRGQVTFGDDGLHVPGFLLTARAKPRPPAAPPADPNAPRPHRPPMRIPLLQVDLVDVTTAALVLRDRRGGVGEPLQLTGRLFAPPWAPRLDGDEPAPARLQLSGTALPLCQEVRSELQLHLYELAPRFELQLAATGIDFTAVPKLVPALAATTGTTAAASLRGRLHGRLDLKRRDPRAFDPQRPFAGELLLEAVELRDDANSRSLASLGSIDVIARAIDPRRGDTLLRAIDIDRPQLVVDRAADGGLELFGLRLPAPPASAASDAESAATPAAAPTTTDPAAPTPTPAIAAAERPEFAVDRLLVQGASLLFTDHTTTPPTPLPIADGDLELLRFSTRAFTEPRPLRLRASLRGGDVPLERRVLRSSLLAGVIASTAAAVGGADDVHQIESRPALDEMTLRGDLVLSPRPSGEVVAEVLGLELPLLRGFAKQGGVEIADGLLDQRTTVRLRGAEGVTVDSRTVFTWLSLTEPPGGPISTYLRLPAPLDSVLFLLRNDADEHRIPLQLEIPGHGLSSGAVIQAAAEAVIKVLADAVASAALRTTGMVTGAIGLSGGAVSTATGAQTFAAGDPLPAAGDLQPVIEALAADPTLDVVLSHEVGAADLDRARALATPAPAQIAARVEELRQQRQLLLAQRQPLAAELQALYAGAKPPAALALQAQLLVHDEQLGELERTLDQALAMLAGDDPRARQRRTQAALQAIAASRLDAVALELRTALPELAADRIVRRPGRAVPTAGLDGGGRIAAAVRRRNIQ